MPMFRLRLATLSFGCCLFMYASAAVSVSVSGKIAETGPNLVSFNFDWHKNDEEPPAWNNASVQVIDFKDPLLIQAAQALSPAYLRVGGSEGDDVIYNVKGTECAEAKVDPAFCLEMSRWHELVDFCDSNGLKLAFGLNAMNGRTSKSSPMNMTNLAEFMRYNRENGVNVAGYEFGNELSPKVDVTTYANDFVRASTILSSLYSSGKPKMIGPDINTDGDWISSFLAIANKSIDVVTYHDYVGYGLDPDLAKKVVTVGFLQQLYSKAQSTIAAQKAHAPNAEIWIGEAAAAWHSGRDTVTNAFESSFWYADALAVLAEHSHTALCRQTLIGGYYGLLNRTNYEPNPDFYTGLIFKTTMGNTVLGHKASDNKVRTHAQCTPGGTGVTVLLISLYDKESQTVTFNGLLAKQTSASMYQLTADALSSRYLKLNGKTLTVTSDRTLPSLSGKTVDTSSGVSLPPYSITFLTFPDASCPQ